MKKQRISAFLLALILLVPVLVFSSSAKGCLVCDWLSKAGFPDSYLSPLCALSLSHPGWEFVPLKVTELSSGMDREYTFDYVLEEECCVSGRSLVSAKEVFSPYHREGSDLYDRGFYNASRDAVAYFLDPRNFLSQTDIFQFLLLSSAGEVSVEQMASVLKNSAVKEVFPKLEEKLIALGKEMNLNPLFLAARLRQEQGSEGNALLFGKAGELLEDESFDGIYNIFNMGASGKGEKEVYRTGAEYAASLGWDSPEKALVGGARILGEDYVKRHQNTLYLQKWNVDPRSVNEEGLSRNFWAQFMQNIGAAKTESDFLYQVLKEEEGLVFLIPVYENMPEKPCPDPAGGTCPAFASGKIEDSPHFFPEEVPVQATVTESTTEKKEENRKEKSLLPAILLVSAGVVSGGVLLFLRKRKK